MRLNYARADIGGIRLALGNTDWEASLRSDSVETNCTTLKGIIHSLESKFVPVGKVKTDRVKPICMTHRAQKLVGKDIQSLENTKNRSMRQGCHARTVNESRTNFAVKMSENITQDNMSFFAHVRSKSKTTARIYRELDKCGWRGAV